MAQHEAPGVHRAIEELCAKAGIPKPLISLTDTSQMRNAHTKFTWGHIAAATEYQNQPRIILGSEFFSLMKQPMDAEHMSDEVRAILAHEIGHLKMRDTELATIGMRKLSPHLGVLAGLAGVFIYDKVREHGKKMEEQGKSPEEIRAAQHEQIGDMTAHHSDQPDIMEPIGTIAKYVAGGLLGGAVGVLAYRHMHHFVEFRADRISAELMGDGKPLARGLKQYVEEAHNRVKADPNIAVDAGKQDMLKKLLSKMTHPPTGERLRRLNEWVPG